MVLYKKTLILRLILVIEILLFFWTVVLVPSWSWPTGKYFVTTANQQPVADAGTDTKVSELDGSVTLNGVGSYDSNAGQKLTFFWSELVDDSDGCSLLSFSDPYPVVSLKNSSNEYLCTFRLEVNDGQVDSLPDDVTVFVDAQDQMPAFISAGHFSFEEGVLGQATIQLVDPEEGEIDFIFEDTRGDFLAAGESLESLVTIHSSHRLEFSWNPTYENAGQYEFTVKADDGKNQITQEVLIEVVNVNRTPVFEQSLPDISVSTGVTIPGINLHNYFSDPDGDLLTFTVVEDSDLLISLQAGELSITVPKTFKGPAQMYFIAAESSGEIAVSNELSVALAVAQTTGNPEFVSGTTSGLGVVTIYNKKHDSLYTWTAFTRGGVLPKLISIADETFVLATKFLNRQQFAVFSIQGEVIDSVRLSSLIHWNFSLVVDSDHNSHTSEIILIGKRGSSIFLKLLRFNSSTQQLTISKSTKVTKVNEESITVVAQGSSIMLTDSTGKTIFLWNL